MKLKNITCYLVHPMKHEQTKIVPIETKLKSTTSKVYQKIEAIFSDAEEECLSEIIFKPDSDGKQNNAFKDKLKSYALKQNSINGKAIANALQDVTNKQSGLGLFFIAYGEDGTKKKFVLSRFVAEEGISAKASSNKLSLEFVEKFFMKKSTSYKSAMFKGVGDLKGMTGGSAVDKQASGDKDGLARYWTNDFLHCMPKTTPAEGTIRLAKKLQETLKGTSDIAIKEEITSAITLLKNCNGQLLSAKEFCRQFKVSEVTKQAIKDTFKHDKLFNEEFNFDSKEFHNLLSFRSIELNTGVLITADSYGFDEKVNVEETANGLVNITTSGKIVDEKLMKAKR
jgi:hypothetical protein